MTLEALERRKLHSVVSTAIVALVVVIAAAGVFGAGRRLLQRAGELHPAA